MRARLPLAAVAMGATPVLGVLSAVFPAQLATVVFGAPAAVALLVPRFHYWSLLAILVLAPFGAYVKAFTGLPYAPVVLDLTSIALCALVIGRHVHDRSLQVEPPTLVVVAFMTLGFVQVFNPLGPGLELASYGYRFLALPLLGFLIGRYLVSSRDQLRQAVVALVVVGSVVAAYGVKQSFGLSEFDHAIVNSRFSDPITYQSLGQARVFSTMSSPFHLAYFMGALILLLAALFSVRLFHPVLLIPLLLASVAMVLTIVRASWFGLLGGMTFLLLTHMLARSVRLAESARVLVAVLLLAGVTLGVVSVLGSDSALGTRLASLVAPTEEVHFQLRADSWTDTIVPALLMNPLGHGMGSDSTALEAKYTAHNGFLYVGIEMGVFGIALLVYLLAWGLKHELAFARSAADPFLQATRLWVAAWLVASCVQGLTGPLIEVYPVNFYLWFFLGAHLALSRATASRR